MKNAPAIAAWIYFIAMALFVTFPGVKIANKVEPYILGLPFILAWYMGWIIGSVVIFYFLYRQAQRS